MQKAARHSIPRGFHPTYILCSDEECQDLLKQYEEFSDPDIADHLIESVDAARWHRWEELASQMNFMHSSQKSGALIRRHGAAQQLRKSTHSSVSANAVAAHLIQVAKALHNKKFERQVRIQGRTLLQQMSTRVFLIHSWKRRFQLLCRRWNQRQPRLRQHARWILEEPGLQSSHLAVQILLQSHGYPPPLKSRPKAG